MKRILGLVFFAAAVLLAVSGEATAATRDGAARMSVVSSDGGLATAISDATAASIDAAVQPKVPLALSACQQKASELETASASGAGGNGNGNGKPPKPSCGDGTCDANAGETSDTCPSDCPNADPPDDPPDPPDTPPGGLPQPRPVGCGDGICAWPAEHVYNCRVDCPCQTIPLGSPLC